MKDDKLEELKSKCEMAAQMTEDWMLNHLYSENLYNISHNDPASYYKWPLTLSARGKREEASKLLNWICEHCLQLDGDFQSNRSGFHLEFHNYANLWLILAANNLGEDKRAEQMLGFILNNFNRKTGGLSTNPNNKDAITEDPLSASFLGLAVCEMKNKDVADLILHYLTSLLDQQEDSSRFWLRTRPDGTLIKEVPKNVDPKVYVLELGEEEESYYFLGSICLFLASYLENFDDQEAADLAYRLDEILENIGEKALSTIWAAKVAPGCIGLYATMKDRLFLDLAEPVIRAVLGGQTSDGYWLKGGKPWITVSAEQCYWLTYINKRL